MIFWLLNSSNWVACAAMLFKTSKGRLPTIDALSDKNEETIETVSESVGYTERKKKIEWNTVVRKGKKKRIQLIKTEKACMKRKKKHTENCRLSLANLDTLANSCVRLGVGVEWPPSSLTMTINGSGGNKKKNKKIK